MPNDNDQSSISTEVALLRQDFGNMKDDIAEMKRDFKEFRQFYVTREKLAEAESRWMTAHNTLAKQVNEQFKTAKGFLAGVGVIVVAAVVLAYFFHIPAKF
jgi:hypothetical protein